MKQYHGMEETHLSSENNYVKSHNQKMWSPVKSEWQPSSPANSWSADSTSSSSSSESSSANSFYYQQGSPLASPRMASSHRKNYHESFRPHGTYYSPFEARKKSSAPPRKIPEWKPEQCVALDAEMVGVGQYGQDSSIARVVIIDWFGEVLFDEYIKQTQRVTDHRTFISGITPQHLENAKLSLREARKQILRILYGRLLIGHALKNDLKALGISHPWWLIRDTARYEPFMQTLNSEKVFWPRKLKDLSAEMLGKEIQVYGQPHSPYEDAMAALNLYRLVQPEWERVMQKKAEKTNDIQAEQRHFQRQLAKKQKYILRQQVWAQHQQQLACQYHNHHQQLMWGSYLEPYQGYDATLPQNGQELLY